MKTMASEPNRPSDPSDRKDHDNVVSLREARARQAAQARKLNAGKAGARTFGDIASGNAKKMPAFLIFLGLLALVVAFKFLMG